MVGDHYYQLTFDTLGTNAKFVAVNIDTATGAFAPIDGSNQISVLRDANIGMYQAGFYPTMMFGLPAVAIAMAFRAEDEYKKQV